MSGPKRTITIINSIPQPWQRMIVTLIEERDKAKAELHSLEALTALPEVQALIAEAYEAAAQIAESADTLVFKDNWGSKERAAAISAMSSIADAIRKHKGRRKDFYHFLSQEGLDALEAEFQAGPQPMLRMGNHWGDGLSVICAGDEAQMMKVAAVRFSQKFHSGPCHMGHYGEGHGGSPLPTIAERLALCKRGEGQP